MLVTMDPFTERVEQARQLLSRREGREISIRELARRSGIAESTLNYTLKGDRPVKNRRVSPGLVAKLARVLPSVTEADLMRAAQAAAGYQVHEPVDAPPDPRTAIVRYFDSDVTNEERLRNHRGPAGGHRRGDAPDHRGVAAPGTPGRAPLRVAGLNDPALAPVRTRMTSRAPSSTPVEHLLAVVAGAGYAGMVDGKVRLIKRCLPASAVCAVLPALGDGVLRIVYDADKPNVAAHLERMLLEAGGLGVAI